jgi:phosphate-selective porin
LTIEDVYFEYKVAQPLSFVVGQYKMPFSREELRPTSKLLVVDRGEVNDAFDDYGYLGRDVGISIQGQVLENMLPMEYALGIFNGNGCGFPGDNDNTKQFAQRMTVDPVNGLSVGINSTQKTDSATNEMVMAHGCDLLFQKGGASIESEILLGETEPDKTMIGGYLAGAYRIGWFEPAVKIERLYSDSRETEDYAASFTYGLNWYFHKKARLQANCITSILPEQEACHVVVVQAQVGF